jgi:regulator of protease activity HflC (stomatin/prohibitin superfamily)
MSPTWMVAVIAFFASFLLIPALLGIFRLFGAYAVVEERRYHVYQLFGQVFGVIDEPGIYCLWTKLGWKSLFLWLPQSGVRTVDMRLDQTYLRSQAVNSEEGAPMGIGVWYEMYVSNPEHYLFKNADPRGSLRANVANTTVRCLSNMPLSTLLEDRHRMSQTVRHEVTPQSKDWGYEVGSVYIRKVHFRDHGMVRQIEEKVVNRLRQVTSAIRQDGANQVSIITSSADREAAVEFAKAQALRPQIVGAALHEIAADKQVSNALFEILEIQKLVEGQAKITLLPAGNLAATLIAAGK